MMEQSLISMKPFHVLTGCYTVSYPFGYGRISAANLLLISDVNLDVMWNIDTPDETVIGLGSTVLLYLYS